MRINLKYIFIILSLFICGCNRASNGTTCSPIISPLYENEETAIPTEANSNEVTQPTAITVFDTKKADLFGDNRKQIVDLEGEYLDKSKRLTKYSKLVVRNPATDEIIAEENIEGSTGIPSLFIGDLNGDKADDIMITIPDGSIESIYEYKIFTLVDNDLTTLSMQELNLEYNFTYYYDKEIARIRLCSEALDKTYIVTVNDDLAENYKNTESAFPKSYSKLEPIDIDQDGVYEMKCSQWLYTDDSEIYFGHFDMYFKNIDGNWIPNELKLIDANVREETADDLDNNYVESLRPLEELVSLEDGASHSSDLIINVAGYLYCYSLGIPNFSYDKCSLIFDEMNLSYHQYSNGLYVYMKVGIKYNNEDIWLGRICRNTLGATDSVRNLDFGYENDAKDSSNVTHKALRDSGCAGYIQGYDEENNTIEIQTGDTVDYDTYIAIENLSDTYKTFSLSDDVEITAWDLSTTGEVFLDKDAFVHLMKNGGLGPCIFYIYNDKVTGIYEILNP